jgi:hypothetical protein
MLKSKVIRLFKIRVMTEGEVLLMDGGKCMIKTILPLKPVIRT